ncbi:enhancer of mRNA decapping [Lithohypha guttulata]|uniref:Enhancer of mRNA-decapping protein 3 n=1 Tax=Lithohypha guttulata TaxID=1690604 RepID=A0AAN7SWL6_9EURO|nr:enhancer of mRNA decapping [Lithohypha guttulata]
MAAEFIGYSILVTLRSPPGFQLDGVVSDVINQKLYLRDVTVRSTGQRLTSYALDATSIADLEIAPAKDDESPTPTGPTQQPLLQQSSFVDPAILSFNRNARQPQIQPTLQTSTSPITIADSAVISPVQALPQRNLRGQSSISSIGTARKQSRRDSTATATLTEPFSALEITKQQPPNAEDAEKRISQTGPGIIDLKDVHPVPQKQSKKQPGKGRGWRNTPLIEEKPRPGRRQRGRYPAEDPNGWATEDATDIADMGEFDFEGNHAKFDKRKVFDDIRRDDTTADEERLVSFNRNNKPRPGTNGGKNLHFTENVLDVPDTQDTNRWKSEAGETEDEVPRDDNYSSGRNSRRAASRRPVQTRKGSAIPSHLDRKEPSPRPLTRIATGSPLNGSVSGNRASFRIASNNKPCHAISPLQMLELEQLCTSELGLTEDMLCENAGRSIAEAVLKSSSIMSASLINTVAPQAQTEVKNVLFLLGNHKSAARALAAARHLRNRRVRVTVCLVGLERGEEHLLEIVRKQLKIYRASQGYVERWDDYQAKVANGAAMTTTIASNISAIQPPDFVVDCLLGVHHAFDELRTDEQATIFSMIKWVNLLASKNPEAGIVVLSLDVPSGVSAASGVVTEVDGTPLLMATTHIVSLGAPKVGSLAYMAGEYQYMPQNAGNINHEVAVSVADIGLSLVAWQRNGSRRRQGVDFGKDWVLPLRIAV